MYTLFDRCKFFITIGTDIPSNEITMNKKHRIMILKCKYKDSVLNINQIRCTLTIDGREFFSTIQSPDFQFFPINSDDKEIKNLMDFLYEEMSSNSFKFDELPPYTNNTDSTPEVLYDIRVTDKGLERRKIEYIRKMKMEKIESRKKRINELFQEGNDLWWL